MDQKIIKLISQIKKKGKFQTQVLCVQSKFLQSCTIYNHTQTECPRSLVHFYQVSCYKKDGKDFWDIQYMRMKFGCEVEQLIFRVLPQKSTTMQTMALILDGESEISAHVWSNLCYQIYLRRLIRSRSVTNLFFFSGKAFFPSELPATVCPKIYSKSVLHMLTYRFAIYLSRCSTKR